MATKGASGHAKESDVPLPLHRAIADRFARVALDLDLRIDIVIYQRQHIHDEQDHAHDAHIVHDLRQRERSGEGFQLRSVDARGEIEAADGEQMDHRACEADRAEQDLGDDQIDDEEEAKEGPEQQQQCKGERFAQIDLEEEEIADEAEAEAP